MKKTFQKPAREIVVLAHNIRSTHNVGAIFRTSEGFGISKIIFSGYTPFPTLPNEDFSRTQRLPFIAEKLTKQIAKTALGAEDLAPFEVSHDIFETISELKLQGFTVVALEQNERSTPLKDFKSTEKIALLLGEEVHGITPQLIQKCDQILEIPMFGHKESFNVSVAAGIALYKIACE
ncbi:MAG: TrmH family RNA methyltransferase [bacterium]|nr:TrmH family RNA methyltransferase [bacterium]